MNAPARPRMADRALVVDRAPAPSCERIIDGANGVARDCLKRAVAVLDSGAAICGDCLSQANIGPEDVGAVLGDGASVIEPLIEMFLREATTALQGVRSTTGEERFKHAKSLEMMATNLRIWAGKR